MSDTKKIAEMPDHPDRRSFLKRASMGSAVAVASSFAFGGLLKQASAVTSHSETSKKSGLTEGDREILIAAEIAEALAVTTYTNIINTAPFFGNLESDDQGYLINARNEEMSHYLLEQSATAQPSPFTKFYYPANMFADAQTTLNVLVTLEDAFIAAYLVGVRNFSTPDLRVAAARIMGIESDHRTLARVVGPGVASSDGGPIENITGFAGVPESVDPKQQRRLRAHTLLGAHFASCRRPYTILRCECSELCRVRYQQGLRIPAVHPGAAQFVGRIHFIQGLLIRQLARSVNLCAARHRIPPQGHRGTEKS